MRKIFLILLLYIIPRAALADHISGGEMYYTFLGFSNGLYNYKVTLKLFMRCNAGRQFPDPAIISVFDRGSFGRIQDINVSLGRQTTIQISDPDPCITDPPTVCYDVAYYDFQVSLGMNPNGYILATQVNYRLNGISNLYELSLVGATYSCEIPGTVAPGNNSAYFTGSDLVTVCAGNFFSYSFAAKDPDGDALRYSFCSAFNSTDVGINTMPVGPPPYQSLPYTAPDYSSSLPMGARVSIDPQSGQISGVAPPGGIYVVTVCVEEIRGGQVISTQRKDLHIHVADCSVAAAQLEEDYMLCGDTRNAVISNISNSPMIVSHEWTLFNETGNPVFTTQAATLDYNFPQNGTYSVRLIVNKNAACTDTGYSKIFVYPGLKPDFDVAGICNTSPSAFIDKTTVESGSLNSWSWDFGETPSQADTSTLRNPIFTYPREGLKNVRLIVTTTEGCRDTISKTIQVVSKPPVNLAFRDTLICVNDQLQLWAESPGLHQWSPTTGIIHVNPNGPVVSPATTTMYYVDINVDGCLNRDSVLVRVTDHVNLQTMGDTTICNGDEIQMHIESDGLQFAWIPAENLNNATVRNPKAITDTTTRYSVIATIGGCSASGSFLVSTKPYPIVQLNNDTIICFNTPAFLQVSTNGDNWSWLPANGLSDVHTLNPVVNPTEETEYIFSATLNDGCPKPRYDTVVVTVMPRIFANAGNDTVAVVGQPLQLSASGGVSYQWSPPFALSATDVQNPVALFNQPTEGILYTVQAFDTTGCHETAEINVKVFATGPTVFVPTAFTPNRDGLNDVLRPILAGMQRLEYFQVYNRWGQLVFSTSREGEGWDGRVNGQVQPSSVYVWMVKATDYNGQPFFSRGTVTLLR